MTRVHLRAAACTGCRSRPGSSSSGGSSTARAGPGPTPTRCPPLPTADSLRHHRQGRRRRQRPAGRRCGPAPGCSSRARTAALHAGVTRPAARSLIGAGIGITPLRALLEELPPGRDETVVITGSARQPTRPRRRADRAGPRPGAAASTRRSATANPRGGWLPADGATLARRTRRCCTWCRTSPQRDVSSAARRPGSTRSSRPPSSRRRPRPPSTPSASPTEPLARRHREGRPSMRRIVLWAHEHADRARPPVQLPHLARRWLVDRRGPPIEQLSNSTPERVRRPARRPRAPRRRRARPVVRLVRLLRLVRLVELGVEDVRR